MKSKIFQRENGNISQKIITKMDYWDHQYIETDEVEMPKIGKTYFVWTRHYVGPNQNINSDINIGWTDDDEWNNDLIENGFPGNSDRNITRYHGWCGTTNDNHVSADGVRTCIQAERKELKKTVHYTITFGPDQVPDKD